MDNESDEFIEVNKLVEKHKKQNQSSTEEPISQYSNFNDVIKEDYLHNKNNNLLNKDKFLYQPQFREDNNICTMKIIGFSEAGKKPMVKVGQLKILKDTWTIIGHLYNLSDLESNKTYFDIISLTVNKPNFEIALSLRFIVDKKDIDDKYSGTFSIWLTSNVNNKNEIIKLKDIEKYPNSNKAIELLIKELSNTNIIDKYD